MTRSHRATDGFRVPTDRGYSTIRIDGFNVEFTSTDDALRSLKPEWDALFVASRRPSGSGSHNWVTTWWQAFGNHPRGAGAGTRLFLMTIRDTADRLVAIFPFYEEMRRWHSLLPCRLRLIGHIGGDGEFDMTEEPCVLIRSNYEAIAPLVAAKALRRELECGRWDMLFFRVFQEGAETPALLEEAKAALDPVCKVWIDAIPGPDYAELPDRWIVLNKNLSKSMRDNLAYYPRLLTRDGHKWQIRTWRAPDEVRAAARRVVALHRARAKSRRGPVHTDHMSGLVQARFLEELMATLAQEGQAFISELVIGDEVVAAHAFIEIQDVLTIYYSGYKDSWYKYSPIFVIDAHVFQAALERGVRRLNFLRTSGQWKARWGASTRAGMLRLVATPRRPGSMLRVAAYVGWRKVRDRVMKSKMLCQNRIRACQTHRNRRRYSI